MADGPVIQRASELALRHGFGLSEILETVAAARVHTAVPIVLFSYYNPLFQFGPERLAREAKRAGVDGVLATDLVPEEAADFAAQLRSHDLDMIFLVAPTSTDARLRLVADQAAAAQNPDSGPVRERCTRGLTWPEPQSATQSA